MPASVKAALTVIKALPLRTSGVIRGAPSWGATLRMVTTVVAVAVSSPLSVTCTAISCKPGPSNSLVVMVMVWLAAPNVPSWFKSQVYISG